MEANGAYEFLYITAISVLNTDMLLLSNRLLARLL